VEHHNSIDNKVFLPSLKLPVTSQELINTPVKSDRSMGKDILTNSPSTLAEDPIGTTEHLDVPNKLNVNGKSNFISIRTTTNQNRQ
jgi:hypothetical protein